MLHPRLLPNSGYDIANSAVFTAEGTDYLHRTNATTGDDPLKFTVSAFIKRATIADAYTVILGSNTGNNAFDFVAVDSDQFGLRMRNSSGVDQTRIVSEGYLRDTASWYHLVAVYDSANATEADRVKLYISNEEVTDFAYSNYPALDAVPNGNFLTEMQIGRTNLAAASFYYASFYMAELHFIDGQALTPDDFAQLDPTTNQWVAKKYQGTYGTNGFYLNFENGADLGEDSSGNGNDFTNVGVTQSTDTPTNNHATLNTLMATSVSNTSFSNAGRTMAEFADTYSYYGLSTVGMTQGKYYFEALINTFSNASIRIGISNSQNIDSSNVVIYHMVGQFETEGVTDTSPASSAASDVIGVAVDLDTNDIEYFKNGVSLGAKSFTTGEWFAHCRVYANSGGAGKATFLFTEDSWTYSAPSGYKALSSKNLPEPEITKPNLQFTPVIYDDGAGAKTVGFQPDLVWFKSRGSAYDHKLVDSVRGATKAISTNIRSVEATDTTGLTSFDSNGFTVGADTDYSDTTGLGMVAWCWKDGITAGFDIVTGTKTVTNEAFSHSLGITPDLMIFFTTTDSVTANVLYHHEANVVPKDGGLVLDNTAAWSNSTAYWNDTAPTTTQFTVGSNVGGSSESFIAYLFAEVEGFSKFGSYVGNGSTDGPFVYLGFKPALVIVKRVDATANWHMLDSSRSNINPLEDTLYPNQSDAEAVSSGNILDTLSNGFKVRGSSSAVNTNSGDYVYMAFAESPFKYSTAR